MKATTAPPESVNGVPIRLDAVDNFIFEGLQSRFLSTFNTKTVWSTSTDRIKSLEKLFPDKKAPITYPYAFLKLASWQRAEDRGSIRAASMRGARVSVSTDNRTTTKVRLLPVDFTVSVEWYSNSFKDLLDISRRWMFISQKGSLNFQVEYGQTSFDIKTVPDTSVNFPTREADPDNVQEYMMETTLVVLGYISETEPMSEQVIDVVDITATTSVPISESTTLWSFKTPPPK